MEEKITLESLAEEIIKPLDKLNEQINKNSNLANIRETLKNLNYKHEEFSHSSIQKESHSSIEGDLGSLKNKIGLYIFRSNSINKEKWEYFKYKMNEENNKSKVPGWNSDKSPVENVLYVGKSKNLTTRLEQHMFSCSESTYALKLYDYSKKCCCNNSLEYYVDVFYIERCNKSNELKYTLINNRVEKILHKILEPAIGTSR